MFIAHAIDLLNAGSVVWANRMWAALWQGSLVILLVWAVCRLVPRLPASVRRLLWWMVLLKPLVCLAPLPRLPLPTLPLSATNHVPYAPSISATFVHLGHRVARIPFVQRTYPVSIPRAARPLSARPAERPVQKTPRPSWITALFLSWVGVLGLQVQRSVKAFREVRRIWSSSELITEPWMLREASTFGAAIGLFSVPLLRESSLVSSPLVLGYPGPTILFPKHAMTDFSRQELRMSLAHELAHIRRRDLWMAWVPGLAKGLFFFHPWVILANRMWVQAIEETCDADTLRHTQVSAKEYGRFLLHLGTKRPMGQAGWGISSTFRHLDGRLAALNGMRSISTVQRSMGRGILLVFAMAALPWVSAKPNLSVYPHPVSVTGKPLVTPTPPPSAIPLSSGSIKRSVLTPRSRHRLLAFNAPLPLEAKFPHPPAVKSSLGSSKLSFNVPSLEPPTQSDSDFLVGQWTTPAHLPLPTGAAGIAVGNDGRIYLAGGTLQYQSISDFLVFDPRTRECTRLHDMNTPRHASVATMDDAGRIYVFGGAVHTPTVSAPELKSSEVFDPVTNTWSELPESPNPHVYAGAVYWKGKIFLIGGNDDGIVDELDLSTLKWRQLPKTMPSGNRRDFAMAQGADGWIYVLGGKFPGVATDNVEAFDPESGDWKVLPSLPFKVIGSGATTGPEGLIYLAGGFAVNNISKNTSDIFCAYDPKTGDVTTLPSLPEPRDCIALTIIEDTIYAIGGHLGNDIATDRIDTFKLGASLSTTFPRQGESSWHTLASRK
jgi:beta-lactamase regulating signal transducer with metallopeptidase domain